MISGILDVSCNSRHDFERTHAVSSTICADQNLYRAQLF